ncbi:dihydropyrimidine dehydrogenase [Carpediemonas membranifera]|uniref:dihydropyrimidine dehydrogenase (NADP(+)) n=1 Tax=Carpediemonas membranifera TaxID=201153 RepID=A0A8J6AZR1_9EUKA|nr:dihydropyrimidine dehydrogenase [Carpediemonas membranifera]|eukprot:KAG9389819.1 dihydropyrimidine dehydrogenase [Carpediemonas membranifera]
MVSRSCAHFENARVELEDVSCVPIRSSNCAKCERTAQHESCDECELSWKAQPEWPENEIVNEARRCLYCANAGCSVGCPAAVNTKQMVHACGEQAWFSAAKVVYGANPLALSTSYLCECDDTCRSTCNMSKSRSGAIRTSDIQKFVCRRFKEFRVDPKVHPDTPARAEKVAVIGAGPAGLSAATYLARLGYTVTIFEKAAYAGGLLMSEIPEFRMPKDAVDFEVDLVRKLGVEFKFNTAVGKDVTIAELKETFSAVIVAHGNPDTIALPVAVPSEAAPQVTNSHAFLQDNNERTKLADATPRDLSGKRVIVIGAGDTACDCAQVARRCGADVDIIFRKTINDMRAGQKRINEVLSEGVELHPLLEPKALSVTDGKLSGVEFMINQKLAGRYTATGQTVVRPADLVVFALGARTAEESRLLKSYEMDNNTNAVANTAYPFYVVGDACGSGSVVEAVNDGRTAAASIHSKLTGEVLATMPGFYTAVDEVDLSIEVLGMKFPNPYGLSSAPISWSYENIARCFEAGFGFAVTKTIALNKDLNPNNHIRICHTEITPGSTSYNNVCVITEHSVEYWCETIRKLKEKYPSKIVIASIMCTDKEHDWRDLAERVIVAGADAIEANLSCPNDCHGDTCGNPNDVSEDNAMAMALGVSPDAVHRIATYLVDTAKDRVPVFIKLTPNITDPKLIARAARSAGAHVSMINTVSGIAKILPSGHPWPQVGKERRTISGGLSGDQVRPIAIRQISEVARDDPDCKILGIGGIRSGMTAIQHIYAGASVAQICSAVQRYSYEIVSEMNDTLRFILYAWSRPDLTGYLNSFAENSIVPHGVTDDSWMTVDRTEGRVPALAEMVGKANAHIGERVDLEHPNRWRVTAAIDADKCMNCGACATSCRDNGPGAIGRNEDGTTYVVSPEDCIGCALCSSIACGAIHYEALPGVDELNETDRAKVKLGC